MTKKDFVSHYVDHLDDQCDQTVVRLIYIILRIYYLWRNRD